MPSPRVLVSPLCGVLESTAQDFPPTRRWAASLPILLDQLVYPIPPAYGTFTPNSFTIFPSTRLSRADFAASTLAGVTSNHFSASIGRTSSR